jgi:hypothetical protein
LFFIKDLLKKENSFDLLAFEDIFKEKKENEMKKKSFFLI